MKYFMTVSGKHNSKFCLVINYILITINMASIKNTKDIRDRISRIEICTSRNYIQKWVTILYRYQFIVL
jgi:hypothetical protein